MDYDKLNERLKNAAGGSEGIKMCQDAALLENSYVWAGNVPEDIDSKLMYLE